MARGSFLLLCLLLVGAALVAAAGKDYYKILGVSRKATDQVRARMGGMASGLFDSKNRRGGDAATRAVTPVLWCLVLP